jgi:hypothetical protein
MRGTTTVATARLLDAWLALEMTRVAIGLNTWEGVEYIDRDRLRDLLAWAVRLDAIDGVGSRPRVSSAGIAARLAEAAEEAGYRVDRLRAALAPTSEPAPAPRGGATRPARPARSRRSATATPLSEQDPPQE